MADCRDLEPLFASYVDGDADQRGRATVEAHLKHCPPCRDRVKGEQAAREVLVARRSGLKVCASELLKRRCAAHATPAAGALRDGQDRRGAVRPRWLPLAIAATILLGLGSIFFFGFNRNVEVLAAQLALDHVKCFQFPPAPLTSPADAGLLAKEWQSSRGWPVKIPESDASNDLELLAVRRCGSTEGITAHLMYKWRGAPLSVYVLNNASTRTGGVEQFVEKIGQEAVVWSHDGRTYAVVARAKPSELEPVVKYVKVNAK
jgi:anti-sigma factor RsiW